MSIRIAIHNRDYNYSINEAEYIFDAIWYTLLCQSISDGEFEDEMMDVDQPLERNESIYINVNTQLYETVPLDTIDTCVICSSIFEPKEGVTILDCKHVFHTKCIKEWGHYNASCPVCKQEIDSSISV